jgi:hypothetical protein
LSWIESLIAIEQASSVAVSTETDVS